MTNKVSAVLVRLVALIVKEFITLVKDPASRKILIIPVLAQAILFGYGATYNLEHIPWALYKAENTPAANAVVRVLLNNPYYDLVAVDRDIAHFQARIDRGEALIGVAIGENFAKAYAAGHGRIHLIADARNINTANVAVNNTVGALMEAFPPSSGIQMRWRYRYNENNITRHFIMPGMMLAITMIQVLLLSSLAISRERENGTFDMMLMTPARPMEIFLGKAIPPILISLVQALVVFSVCVLWFAIPLKGTLTSLFLLVLSFSVSCVSLGIAISTVSSTILSSLILAFLTLVPTIVLSGLMTPVSAMPDWMQTLTTINPLRCGLDALRPIYFEGSTYADVLGGLWPLAVVFTLSTALAVGLFSKKIV